MLINFYELNIIMIKFSISGSFNTMFKPSDITL